MIKYFLILVCLVYTTTSLCAQDNLIQNGQFTKGTSSWKVLLTDKDQPIKAQIEHGASYKEYGLADNFVGTNFVELDAKSAIQQTINTKAGQQYKLMFAFAHRPDAGNNQLIVTTNDQVLFTKTLQSSSKEGRFTYKELYFTADAPQTKIGFYSVSILGGPEDKGILLTDIWCELITDETIELGTSEQKF